MGAIGDISGVIRGIGGAVLNLIYLGRNEDFKQERYGTQGRANDIYVDFRGDRYRMDSTLVVNDNGEVVVGTSADNTQGAWW